MIVPNARLQGYHAHVYYDAATRPAAQQLAEAIADKFAVRIGGLFDEPVGPHPVPNLQIIFPTEAFAAVVPWLMLNRQGFDVLVHALTDDSVRDHDADAMWLGTPVRLRLDVLRPGYRAELLPTA